MSIPKDPIILLSFLNLKLRDEYNSLDDLCKSLDLEMFEIEQTMGMIDYRYDAKTNQFK